MKVKELIEELKNYNQDAEIDAIAHYQRYGFSLGFGSSEGVEKHNCDSVSIYIDDLCTPENLVR
jgi:hypothetical protein